MLDVCQNKADDIRSLATFFLDQGEATDLYDYKIKMFQTAARLIEAAESLMGAAAVRPHG